MSLSKQLSGSPSCNEDETFVAAISECRKCSLFCHEGLPAEKCPEKCIRYLYQTLMEKATQQMKKSTPGPGNMDTSDTSWLFTNWCYIFIGVFAIGIAGVIIWINRDKITALIKWRGYRNVRQADNVTGDTPVVIEMEPDPVAPRSDNESPTDPQPPSAPQPGGTEDKATQTTDKFSVEETSHTDEETDQDTEVKSPLPRPSPGKIMEEVADNEDGKSKVLGDVNSQDQNPEPEENEEEDEEEVDEGETEIKRPAPDGAACASSDKTIELEQMTNDDDPKAAYDDEGLDDQLEAAGEQQRLLETGDDKDEESY